MTLAQLRSCCEQMFESHRADPKTLHLTPPSAYELSTECINDINYFRMMLAAEYTAVGGCPGHVRNFVTGSMIRVVLDDTDFFTEVDYL